MARLSNLPSASTPVARQAAGASLRKATAIYQMQRLWSLARSVQDSCTEFWWRDWRGNAVDRDGKRLQPLLEAAEADWIRLTRAVQALVEAVLIRVQWDARLERVRDMLDPKPAARRRRGAQRRRRRA